MFRRMRLLCAAIVVVLLAGIPAVAHADAGIEGLSHTGTGTPTGTKRAESVLWNNDGIWWANMWDTASGDFHIFRLNTTTQRWEDTGTVTDTRANTHSDVLWTGSKLYVASHTFVNDGVAAVSGFPSNLYRYSYSATTKRYTLDSGFPKAINNMKTETLTIDRDSSGRLWATWQQGNKIYVNSTVDNADNWGVPAPIPGGDVSIDDSSSLVAFDGGILVMWDNETPGPDDGFHFAIHPPGGSHTSGWGSKKAAFTGVAVGDDHMNLKWLESDGGRIFAAVKTSKTGGADPLIALLVLDTRAVLNPSQVWQSYMISRVSECPNRVILLIDKTNNLIRTFATYPDPNANVCSSSGGAIYEKDSPLPPQGSTNFSFPSGRGTLRIADTSDPFVHNVSSTKQNVSAATGGLAVLADNNRTSRYWHHFDALGAVTPAPTASFTATPSSGTAPLNVTFANTSSGAPTSWSWDFGDGTTSTAQNPPAKTYSAAGTYTVRLTVTNAGGSNSTTRTVTVNAPAPAAPTADFTATPSSGTAPLDVTFTDASTGSPSSWAWNFGDGTTSTAQNPPVKRYASAGTYTVRLTVTNAGGSNSKEQAITVTAPAPSAPTASFTATPSSGTAPLAVTFDDTSTGVPTGWSWDFGDGATSTAEDPPAKTYSAPGTYTVRLTVTNAGGTDSTTRTVTVTAAPPPPPPSGAITRGREVSTVLTSTASTTWKIATPPETVAEDVLVACLTLTGGSVTAAPAGWAPIAAVTSIANPKVYGYYKVVTAADDPTANYTWTTTSVTGSAGIARYSGASGLDGTATSASGGAAASGTVPGVTTTTAGAMLVGCMGINSGSAVITAPGGLSQAWELGVRKNEVADGVQAAAGATGSKTWSFSASREWAGWLVALRPR